MTARTSDHSRGQASGVPVSQASGVPRYATCKPAALNDACSDGSWSQQTATYVGCDADNDWFTYLRPSCLSSTAVPWATSSPQSTAYSSTTTRLYFDDTWLHLAMTTQPPGIHSLLRALPTSDRRTCKTACKPGQVADSDHQNTTPVKASVTVADVKLPMVDWHSWRRHRGIKNNATTTPKPILSLFHPPRFSWTSAEECQRWDWQLVTDNCRDQRFSYNPPIKSSS